MTSNLLSKLYKISFINDSQKIMALVILSLLPAVLYKTITNQYLGFFALTSLLISAILTEEISAKMLNIKSNILDGTSIITAILLFLSLNCNLTFFIYFIASFSAIAIAKMAYGGMAKNIFNPAMVGWCFVMISFPQFLSKQLDYTASFSLMQSLQIMLGTFNIDSFTSATPLVQYKYNNTFNLANSTVITNILIALGGLFLIYKKLINIIFPVAFVIGIFAAIVIFNYNIAESLILFAQYGPLALAAFYIITDPVTSPSLPKAQFIYSFAIGFIAIVIAKFGNYPIGIAFAVLFVNAFNFMLDKACSKEGLK